MSVTARRRPDGTLVLKIPLGEDAFQIILGRESTWQYLAGEDTVTGYIPPAAVEEILSWAKGEPVSKGVPRNVTLVVGKR